MLISVIIAATKTDSWQSSSGLKMYSFCTYNRSITRRLEINRDQNENSHLSTEKKARIILKRFRGLICTNRCSRYSPNCLEYEEQGYLKFFYINNKGAYINCNIGRQKNLGTVQGSKLRNF